MDKMMRTGVETNCMTADAAHAMLGGDEVISRASFYAALKRGEVPHVRLGRRILIPRHAFMVWLESGSVVFERPRTVA